MTGPSLELMVLRHGIAEERREDVPDAQRSLTPKGRERSLAVLRRLSCLGWRADRMLSSPLTRARQTADLATEAKLAPAAEVVEALAPGADPLPLLADVFQGVSAPSRCCLLLVGHEPDLGWLCCRLLGAPPGAIRLRKAGLALLDLQGWVGTGSSFRPDEARGGAALKLLLSPRALLP